MTEKRRQRIAYLVDPRFPGGTSSALAEELKVVSQRHDVHVFGVQSKMFKGDTISPKLEAALDAKNIGFSWCNKVIASDIIVIQNPAFLKFEECLPVSLLAHTIIVVTHENFYRPTGALSFDIDKVFEIIDGRSTALRKLVAPISAYNRSGVEKWMNEQKRAAWSILPDNWFNICDFELKEPNEHPSDRRGRVSRAGNEKFPPIGELDQSFPQSAEACVMLGADNLVPFAQARPNWDVYPFGSMPVDRFFDDIDFMVYHTSSTWRESFGRVIAEAIAAGKVVITDPETAMNFEDGVVHAKPSEVSQCISDILNQPGKYQEVVKRGQRILSQYSADNFLSLFESLIADHNEWSLM